MGILRAEECEDVFFFFCLEQEEKGPVDKCSWEQIKPIGYLSFELGRKGNHWLHLVWKKMTEVYWIPGQTKHQTALSQYLNPFRILILCYGCKSNLDDDKFMPV